LRKRFWLPLTEEFFCADGQAKVLGSLPQRSVQDLHRAAQEVGLA
jgi:hypothetical protein